MTLDELLDQCVPEALALSALDKAWLEAPDVGKEIIQDGITETVENQDDV